MPEIRKTWAMIPNHAARITNRTTRKTLRRVSAGDTLLMRQFAADPADVDDLDTVLRAALQSTSGTLRRGDGKLLHVVKLVKAFPGSPTVDLRVVPLWYADNGESNGLSYGLRGPELCKYNVQSGEDAEGYTWSFIDLMECRRGVFFLNLVNPSSTKVLQHCFDQCPGDCNLGWLSDINSLWPFWQGRNMPALGAFRPLCPVCIGPQIVDEQIRMRREWEAHELYNDTEDYERRFKRLARAIRRRRRALGYYLDEPEGPRELCVCELCLFPDARGPAPETHEEAVALDQELRIADSTPAPEEKPVAEDEIARLPRMAFEKFEGNATKCTVCLCDFAKDTEVVVLPCKHAICADGCSEWLRHANTCPVCRYRLPTDRRSSSSQENAALPSGEPSLVDTVQEDEIPDLSQLSISTNDEQGAEQAGQPLYGLNFAVPDGLGGFIFLNYAMTMALAARYGEESAIDDGDGPEWGDAGHDGRPRNGSMAASETTEEWAYASSGFYTLVRDSFVRRNFAEAWQEASYE